MNPDALLYKNEFVDPATLPIESTAGDRKGFLNYKKHQQQLLEQKYQREFRDDQLKQEIKRRIDLQDRLQNVPINIDYEMQDPMNTNRYEPFDRAAMTNQPLQNALRSDADDHSVNVPRPRALHIDSRDRDIAQYPYPNHYKIYPGMSFQSVKSVELISVEFPNSAQVIISQPPESANNNIYWINEEDAAIGFPIYQAVISPGSYTSFTLQDEITYQMNLVPRRSDGGLHEFTVTINTDTDIVSFEQLKSTLLPTDPLTTTLGSNVITVNQPGHGFITDDEVTIQGANAVDGILSAYLNGIFQVTVINANTYTYEVAVDASSTVTGGGASIRAGIPNNFKLLWSNLDTPGQILGFEQEDSSAPLANPITNIIVGATTMDPGIVVSPGHGLVVGQVIYIIETNVIPAINGSHRVTAILDADRFQISCRDTVYNSMVFYDKLSDTGYWIYSPVLSNYGDIREILISGDGKIVTWEPHRLVVGEMINISSTATIPDINGPQVVTAVINPYTFAIGKPIINFDMKPSGMIANTEEPVFGNYGSNRLVFTFRNHTLVTGDYIMITDCNAVGGIPATSINVNYGNKRQNEIELSEYVTRKRVIVLDVDHFQIITDTYATFLEQGGGVNTCITADTNPKSICANPDLLMTQTINFLGFRSIQENTDCNGNLNRVVSLDGEQYVFMTCPQLNNIRNTGAVNNIFAKILLSDPPGTQIFNTFVSVKKEFDENAFPSLSALEFTFYDHDGKLYNFNNVNHSFTLLFYEYGDRLKNAFESSYRGKFDNSGALVYAGNVGKGGGGGGGNRGGAVLNTSNTRIRRSNNQTGAGGFN